MNKEKKIEQNNWYNIYDSMGRPTDIYLIASNIKEAYETAKRMEATKKMSYWKVKRCYNGGVRGSQV